ncbi:MAG: hypothetical protein ABIH92_01070 [Nanoarchaeota archaeon]
MKVEVRYAGELIHAESGLQSGRYRFGRSSGLKLYITGPGFGKRGSVFGNPDRTVSGMRFDADGNVTRAHLTMDVAEDSVTLRNEQPTNVSRLNGVPFEEKTVRTPGNYVVELGIGSSELDLALTE